MKLQILCVRRIALGMGEMGLTVVPAQAEIQECFSGLGSRFRGKRQA